LEELKMVEQSVARIFGISLKDSEKEELK